MGQEAHRKYKDFKKAKSKLRSYSSQEQKQAIRIKELEYQAQKREDDQDYKRANDLFDWANGRD